MYIFLNFSVFLNSIFVDQTFSKTFVLLTKRGATIPDAVTLLELGEKGCGERSVTLSPRDTKKDVLRKLKQ